MDLRLRHKNENPVRKSSDFLSGSSGFKVHLIHKDTKYCSKKGTWKTPRRKDSGDASDICRGFPEKHLRLR